MRLSRMYLSQRSLARDHSLNHPVGRNSHPKALSPKLAHFIFAGEPRLRGCSAHRRAPWEEVPGRICASLVAHEFGVQEL